MEAFWLVLLLLFIVLAFSGSWQRLYPQVSLKGEEQAVLKYLLCLICSGSVAVGYAGLIIAFYQCLDLMSSEIGVISMSAGIGMWLLCHVPSLVVTCLFSEMQAEACGSESGRGHPPPPSMPVWTTIAYLRRGRGADQAKAKRARRGWGRHL